MSPDTTCNNHTSQVVEDSAFWSEHITQFSSTNLSRKAYCRNQDLNYERFQYWYHKKMRPAKASAIPIRVTAPAVSSEVLCTLQLGHNRLLIHSPQALSLLLERYV